MSNSNMTATDRPVRRKSETICLGSLYCSLTAVTGFVTTACLGEAGNDDGGCPVSLPTNGVDVFRALLFALRFPYFFGIASTDLRCSHGFKKI